MICCYWQQHFFLVAYANFCNKWLQMLSLTSLDRPCAFVGMVDLNELELRQRREYAAAVRAIRASKGWTQQQAADAAGITLQAWANYERAERPFKKSLIATVCRVLGITPEELELKRAELAPPAAPQPRENLGFAERPNQERAASS